MALDWLAMFSWLVVYLGIGALALPATAAVCSRLPFRGAGLSFAFGLATVAVVGYWVGQVRFGAVAAIVGLLGLAAMSWLALRRGASISIGQYANTGLVFTAAFALLIGFRIADPAAWPGGGEKFLDHGLLAVLIRSTALPPEDMWFAGEPVQYYYGGHMLAALLAKLTGTSAPYAYNYALSGYFAVYVATAYGLAGSIAAGSGRSYTAGGLMGAFFVGLASNLSTPIRLVAWALPDGLGRALLSLASLEAKGLALGPSRWDFWHASRVIDGGLADGGTWQFINEFPLFAFLNGDLHAHMMSPPFLLLVAGLGFAYYRASDDDRASVRVLPLVAIAPLVGLLLMVNTWDVPTALGVTALAVAFAPTSPVSVLPERLRSPIASTGRLRAELRRYALAGVVTVLIAVGGLLVALPWVLGPGSVRGLGFDPAAPMDVPGLLVVFGVFLGISLAYLIARSGTVRRALAHPGVWIGVLAAIVLAYLLEEAAVALFVPPLALGWWALATGRHPDGESTDGTRRSDEALGYETVLLVGVLGLLIVIEFVYVVEQAGPGPYNTMFKYFVHVWALWGVVAGAALPAFLRSNGVSFSFGGALGRMLSRLRGGGRAPLSRQEAAVWRERGRRAAVGLTLVLILSMALYGAFAVSWKHNQAAPPYTLDARAYVATEHPGEYEAIEWLADRPGRPTLLSAPGEDIYRWVNAPSSLTGIPTVAGWAEQIGYRGATAYWTRVEHVNRMFAGSPTERAQLLRTYDVRYIYVGPVERHRYEGADLRYDDEPGISVVHESGSVVIYEVDRSALVVG